jgi:hypothetical protein
MPGAVGDANNLRTGDFRTVGDLPQGAEEIFNERSIYAQNHGNCLTWASAGPSNCSELNMADRKEIDLLKIFGTILLTAGVAVWGVYAVLCFGMDWDVKARQFLPYHLAGVVPGTILRRHRFFWGIVRRLLS